MWERERQCLTQPFPLSPAPFLLFTLFHRPCSPEPSATHLWLHFPCERVSASFFPASSTMLHATLSFHGLKGRLITLPWCITCGKSGRSWEKRERENKRKKMHEFSHLCGEAWTQSMLAEGSGASTAWWAKDYLTWQLRLQERTGGNESAEYASIHWSLHLHQED